MNMRQQVGEVEAYGVQLVGAEVVPTLLNQHNTRHQYSHAGIDDIAEHVQVPDRCRVDLAGVTLSITEQSGDQFFQVLHGSRQRLAEFAQGLVDGGGKGPDLVGGVTGEGAAIADRLTSYQIECLNAVGAFVDLRNTTVARQLLLVPFADEAATVKGLLVINSDFQSHVGEGYPNHRNQQRHQLFHMFTGDHVFAVLGDIQLHHGVAGEGAAILV